MGLKFNAWFLDDGTLVGLWQVLWQAWDLLVDKGKPRGLFMSLDKSVYKLLLFLAKSLMVSFVECSLEAQASYVVCCVQDFIHSMKRNYERKVYDIFMDI